MAQQRYDTPHRLFTVTVGPLDQPPRVSLRQGLKHSRVLVHDPFS